MEARKVTALFAVAVATIGIAATIVAQDFQGQRRDVAKPIIGAAPIGTAPMQAAANSADSQLAACLIVANQGEIALGKLAQQRAKDEDVKQFAEKMVKEHSQFLEQLERFAGNEGNLTKDRLGGQAAGDVTATTPVPGSADRPLVGATAQPMGSQALNFVALQREIGQKCLDLVQSDLKEKEGAQFDKCYIGGQIGAHMHVLATLEVFRNQASPELASLLDKGIETTKSHLEHAQKIAQALDK